MHPADIQAAMKKAQVAQADIARKLRVSEATVSKVVYDQSRSRRVANAISRAVGIPVSTLWPDAYVPARRRAA